MSDELRQRLLDALSQQGFTLSSDGLMPPDPSCKDNIRRLYTHLRFERLQEVSSWLLSVEEKVLTYFANGLEVDKDGKPADYILIELNQITFREGKTLDTRRVTIIERETPEQAEQSQPRTRGRSRKGQTPQLNLLEEEQRKFEANGDGSRNDV